MAVRGQKEGGWVSLLAHFSFNRIVKINLQFMNNRIASDALPGWAIIRFTTAAQDYFILVEVFH